jgi:hypothetical protein
MDNLPAGKIPLLNEAQGLRAELEACLGRQQTGLLA